VGLDGVKASMADMRSAYTDLRISYADMVAEGSNIAYRFTWAGKHTGQSPSLPIPPTGKEITLGGCILVHIVDGKIVEEFEHSDYLGFLQQLGVVPPLG
jgi:predicted ester cyclase